MSYKVETVIKHAASTVGEGPHWDDKTQTLLYVDIKVGDIHRWDPNTGRDEKIHLDGTVGFVIPRSKGGLIAGLNLKVVSVDWDSGNTSTIGTVNESPENRLNDGKCDASGRLWAGTMMMNMQSPKAANAGSLYSFDTDGSAKKQVENVTVSNGLAWSADNKTMFYIDTPTRQVWSFHFDLQHGTVANKKVAVDFAKIPEFDNLTPPPRPDGMTIDADDNVWVACIGIGAVSQFDPQTGKLLKKVDIPGATMITSVCWGGKNLDELYVTSIKKQVTDEAEKAKESLSGSVFRVTGLGVRGRPAYVFQG